MLVNFHKSPGVIAALTAAVLFGASTPLAKFLLGEIHPWLLAGLLYLGSGLGLFIYRRVRGLPKLSLPKAELAWLLAAILAGGVLAPVLLLLGLKAMPASGASLLLNAEAVFTAVLAWVVFRENVDRRILLGMLVIVAGALLLSGSNDLSFGSIWPALAVLVACLLWGLDNNLTRKVSLNDATALTCVKGLVAGTVNLSLALFMGAQLPSTTILLSALSLGLLAYGVSLSLFIVGLRHLGTARTGAYFAVAPFFGAILSIVLLNEPITWSLILAGGLMALGVWLHLTEYHSHEHYHPSLEHEHSHIHDEHHQHVHDFPVNLGEKHTHWHQHQPLSHTHAHYPDAHHQH
ncbi:DMT family transporter [uncultured Thiothrix sp.]|uniref:DMT family transporter n=1 Tax=uncultured Thiothrix sp. TaxID=223185 RepID=UPI002622001B|nr:DMT family transporter [uncultured Thiothrix sp.]